MPSPFGSPGFREDSLAVSLATSSIDLIGVMSGFRDLNEDMSVEKTVVDSLPVWLNSKAAFSVASVSGLNTHCCVVGLLQARLDGRDQKK